MSSRLSPWRLAIALAIAARVVAAPTPGSAAEIHCGETVVGVLASGPDEIGFLARQGEVVSATVVPLIPLPGFEPRWRIADVEGRPVALSNGDHRCTGRCQTAPLPRGSAFTLRIADSGLGIGAYVVTLEAVSATANGVSNGPPEPTCARIVEGAPDGTRPLAPDEVLAGVVDRPGETDTFTLDVAAGGRVQVELRRTGGDDGFEPVWQAFDASGRALTRASEDETQAVTIEGVVTIVVTDAALRATGTYEIGVDHRPPPSTTSSSTTTSTLDDPTTTTGVEPTTSTTTVWEGSSTSTTTGPDGSSTTTSTLLEASTTSTTSVASSTTTTSTGAGSTTTLPPAFDLGLVIPGPQLAGEGMLGGALAAVDGRLLIGAPHDPVGIGPSRVRDAGAVLVVDVAGQVGGPTFSRVLARVSRPEAPTTGDRFGMALAPAGLGVVAGAPGGRVAFVFPSLQEPDATMLVPPIAGADDGFGHAVAAPEGFAVVGAPRADGEAGVAYVFERSTGAPRAALRPATPVVGAHVGAALASSETLVLVGAPGGPAVPGQAFLFDATSGDLLQALVPDASAVGDEFGAAVGFAGSDLLIASPGALEGRGRVDRFDAATGRPTRSYAPPSPTPGERFGASIAIEGSRLVVGAPGDTGAAYVFDLETGVLEATLRKPMPQIGDAFGSAVALAGTRVFVGAPGDDSGTLDGGATYVFDGEVLVAVLRKRLSADGFGASAVAANGAFYVGAPAGAAGDGFVARIEPDATVDATFLLAPEGRPVRFGASLAALGDLVVVGAPESPLENGARVGAVHLFDGTALRSTIQNPSPGDGDEFGFAVGSVDGDVLASAPFAGESDTGLVYRLDTTGRLRVTYGKPAPTAGDFFGASLAGDEGQVLVGAPLDASGGPPSGAVYLFDGETASIVHTIASPNATSDLFGAAVALGQWIVVGAPRAPGDTGSDGTVWVFDRATGALVRRLENPRFGRDDFFGASVALLGDQLLVGAPLADDHTADTGIVYLFEPATGQLVQTFRNPPQGTFDNFGFSVAAGGSGLLVGSPGPSRVYVFDPIVTVAALRFGVPLALTATSQCGNGLVEETEACDDGNDIDTDDCRSDCTPGPCCSLDAIGDPSLCDDRNPCTTDSLDPVLGCRYEPSGEPGCCESDADCPDGQCRLCVGCFVYRWDCCEVGSTCVPSNPACVGKTCLDAAYCQCEGKLDCGAETLPETVRDPFALACNTLRLQVSVAPESTLTRPELVVARQATRSARASLRKTIRAARAAARTGGLSRECRKSVVAQVKVVRQAIPRGKRLRRCLSSQTSL